MYKIVEIYNGMNKKNKNSFYKCCIYCCLDYNPVVCKKECLINHKPEIFNTHTMALESPKLKFKKL